MSDISAVELPVGSCNHEVVEDATVPFETKTESSTNPVMKLDRANIDVDTVEDSNVAAAITEVVEETNDSDGSNVDWLYQSSVSLDIEPGDVPDKRSDLASKIGSKVMQAASSTVVLGIGISDLVIFVAFTLLILLSVSRLQTFRWAHPEVRFL